MKVLINGNEFDLRDGRPYATSETNITLFIVTTSMDDVFNIITDENLITIPEILSYDNTTFDNMRKISVDLEICEITFNFQSIKNTLKTHTDDIEAISEAIVELAEIIGGGE